MPKITMTRRFYVGSTRMSNGENENWMKTYSEALESAKALVESGNDDIRYVVEVVAIVRRRENPVIIEEIRK